MVPYSRITGLPDTAYSIWPWRTTAPIWGSDVYVPLPAPPAGLAPLPPPWAWLTTL